MWVDVPLPSFSPSPSSDFSHPRVVSEKADKELRFSSLPSVSELLPESAKTV